MDVYKFGGSSLATAERMKKVFDIIKKVDSCAIVLSALGKKFVNDIKVTDLLIELCNSKNNKSQITKIKNRIKKRFISIAVKLKSESDYSSFIRKLDIFLSHTEHYSDNYIISRGEYFTCLLFSKFTDIPFIDAADIICFNDNNQVSLPETENAVKRIKHKKYITCGFYGTNRKKEIILFPRGGGDISGAILSRVYHSENYYNYTDVNGIYSVSPQYLILRNNIPQINYSILKIICSYGIQVFCEDAIKYIADKNIKLFFHFQNRFSKDRRLKI